MTVRATVLPTDRTLAEAVLNDGDELAFRQLYRRHTPRLYQFVLRFLGGSEMDAEDVVQEVWIQAVRRLGTFRWEARLETWLTAIGLNMARDQLRKQYRRGEPIPLDVVELPSLDRPVAERMDLEAAIASLPDGYRTVFVLHDLEGFTHDEIGQALGISSGTSKSQLSGARRTLRRFLGSVEEGNHVAYRT
ncbi:MAG: sigma-70 family RNA polymerase sigma factor [Gemmatimonadales bacterium]